MLSALGKGKSTLTRPSFFILILGFIEKILPLNMKNYAS